MKDRTRSKRLNGADIYVTRLGWKSGTGGASSCCPEPSHHIDIPSPGNTRHGLYTMNSHIHQRAQRHQSALPHVLRTSSPLWCLQGRAIDASLTWLQLAPDELFEPLTPVRGRALRSETLWTLWTTSRLTISPTQLQHSAASS